MKIIKKFESFQVNDLEIIHNGIKISPFSYDDVMYSGDFEPGYSPKVGDFVIGIRKAWHYVPIRIDSFKRNKVIPVKDAYGVNVYGEKVNPIITTFKIKDEKLIEAIKSYFDENILIYNK